MRKQEDNRAENYIIKHKKRKRWMAYALCVSILTGTITLYMLNKPATAMTEDGAKQVGLVLETADNEFESGLIEQMEQQEQESEQSNEDRSLEASSADSGVSGDTEDSEEREDDLYKLSDEEAVSDSSTDSSESAASKALADDSSDAASSASSDDSGDAASSASSDAAEDASSLGSSHKEKKAPVEVKSDVNIIVSYQNLDGEELAKSKELSITESFDLSAEAREIEGYTFSKGIINDTQITGLVKRTKEVEIASDDEESDEAVTESSTDDASALSEADETETATYTYYEATTLSGDTLEITEDAELKLVYFKVNSKSEFEYKADGMKVKVKLSDPASLPDGIELKVTALDQNTEGYNYDAYMSALNDNAEAIAEQAGLESANTYNEDNTLLFDIAFMYGGEEIQPAEGSVSVSVEFEQKQLTDSLSATSEEEITVVHLPLKDEIKESVEITSTQEATDITSSDIEVKTLTEATVAVEGTEKIEFSEESFSIFAVTVYQKHDKGTHDYEMVLGDAINFGIVANSLHIGESQTNFAAGNLYGQKQSGNNLTNPVEQTFMAARVEGEFKVKNNAAYFIVPSEYTSKISHENAYALKFDTAYSSNELMTAVGKMLEYGRSASADLAKYDSNISIENDSNRKNRDKIDITGYPAGTYYVNLSDVNALFAKQEPTIYKNSNQTIVFNVTDPSSEIHLKKFFVCTDGGQSLDTDTLENNGSYDSINRTIIWNFINADAVYSDNSVVGAFISGKTNATWYNNATSAGWLLFPNVYINSGEWHNTNQKLKQISGTAQFQAYKNIDGKAATVSGFTFKLSVNEPTGWRDIQFITNDTDSPHNIIFDPITFGNLAEKAGNSNYQYVNLSLGQSQDFVYVIDETAGTSDSSGTAYKEDDNYYFAKVTVTCERASQYTDTTYYRVSAPEYYKDFECTKPIDEELPTFNNTTIHGSVGIKLYKYLNKQDPGENTFNFTVRALMSDGTLKNLTNENPLSNVGQNISYSFDYDSKYIVEDSQKNKRIYLVITENDILSNGSSIKITKDKSYIIARVDLDKTGNEVKNVYYFRYDPEKTEEKAYIDKIESSDPASIKAGVASDKSKKSDNRIKDEADIAFYNEGTGLLRIHKMVVNDFGSGFVRDNTGSALLSNVRFRITNKGNGNYIVFTGFTGDCVTKNGWATEYDANTHTAVKTYDVTYNGSAQWTVSGLPTGTYIVDEVADGLTFTYDEYNNYSTVIESANLSRVTKYDVTIDDEEPAEWHYGTGGTNYRKVFSIDIPHHYDQAPEAHVGGSVETVQVCNYYSIPIGPIQITKNFTGGEWTEDMAFTFKIEGIGYNATTSEGASISLNAQPMPQDSATNEVIDTATVTAADAVYDANTGTYTAIAKFASIPFKYEGVYYYKITETDASGNPYGAPVDGVQYDQTVYYVKVVVSKKYTTFTKDYKYKNMTHPIREKYPKKYSGYGENETYTQENEDFFYLGADVVYARDVEFTDVLAECELHLGTNPDTVKPQNNAFIVSYKDGKSAANVAFNNTRFGQLIIEKKWIDLNGNDNSGGRTSLTVDIWQRVVGGNWSVYKSVTLTPDINWTITVKDLPLTDDHGNRYEYSVKEPDEYLSTYSVAYLVGDAVYNAKDKETITVGNDRLKDTGYALGVGSDGTSYGTVTIENTAVVTNTIPSTGGMGTVPFAVIGGLLVLLGASASMLFKKKRA